MLLVTDRSKIKNLMIQQPFIVVMGCEGSPDHADGMGDQQAESQCEDTDNSFNNQHDNGTCDCRIKHAERAE